LSAELAGFNGEIADAGSFEMLQVCGELRGLRGMAAAALAQGIGFCAQRLELLLTLEQSDAQQARLFGPAGGFGGGLRAEFGELLLLLGE
jgi:hypothetical protein